MDNSLYWEFLEFIHAKVLIKLAQSFEYSNDGISMARNQYLSDWYKGGSDFIDEKLMKADALWKNAVGAYITNCSLLCTAKQSVKINYLCTVLCV